MQAKQQRNKKAVKFIPPEEHQALLSEVSGFVAAVGRRGTAEALELGRQLARAKVVLPEKSFGKWVKQECGLTTRHAWNCIAPVERFSASQQDQLVAAAVKPTVMVMLATAEEAKIVEVLGRIVAGEQFTVGQVKQLIKGDARERAPAAMGGAAGLRRAAEAKLKAELERFFKLGKAALKVVEQAAEDIRKGKHVAKTKLADKVEANCQEARALLSSAISPVMAASTTPIEWEKARQIIARLGDSPRWPGKTEFAPWITDEVLPALRFVVHGTPAPGKDIEAESDLSGMGASELAEDGEGEEKTIDDAFFASRAAVVNAPPQGSPRLRIVAPPALVPRDLAEEPEAEAIDTPTAS